MSEYVELQCTLVCTDLTESGGMWHIHRGDICCAVFLYVPGKEKCAVVEENATIRRHARTYDSEEQFWTAVMHTIDECLGVHPEATEIACIL